MPSPVTLCYPKTPCFPTNYNHMCIIAYSRSRGFFWISNQPLIDVPSSSMLRTVVFVTAYRYMNVNSQDAMQRHRLYQQQQQHSLHTLPGGSSPSGDSTCSHQSGASMVSSQQLSPPDGQVQLQQHEFEKAMDTVQTSNSRALLHSLDPTLGKLQYAKL